MKLHYSLVGTVVTIALYRGEKFSDESVEIVKQASFDAAACPEVLMDGSIEKSLAGYGLLKLLQDRTSQEKGVEAKLPEMQRYFEEFFSQGLWKKPSEKKAPGTAKSRRKVGAVLAEAVARLQGITPIQAEGALKDLDKDSFENVTKNQKVLDMVKVIEAEASAEAVDLGDLL